MFHEREQHSPSPYDNPAELDVANLPHSSSYQEALRDGQSSLSTAESTPVRANGYVNPIYQSPVTSYKNPLSSPEKAMTESTYLSTLDPNTDLFSSYDSNNPQVSQMSDASSADDELEENGFVFHLFMYKKSFSATFWTLRWTHNDP